MISSRSSVLFLDAGLGFLHIFPETPHAPIGNL
jgi:hypothetical protein